MSNLIIASPNKDKISLWVDVLEQNYPLIFFDNIETILSKNKQDHGNVLLVLDASLINEIQQLSLLSQCVDKLLIIGEGVPPEQQVQFIHKGALGYSDISIDGQLIVRAIEGILNNEIWLERHLIPQVLKWTIAEKKQQENQGQFNKETAAIFLTLTQREIEVIELIYNGADNVAIASALKISGRTVKAHLSAIYRKLDVHDRFQLVVLLKNLHINHLSNENGFSVYPLKAGQ